MNLPGRTRSPTPTPHTTASFLQGRPALGVTVTRGHSATEGF